MWKCAVCESENQGLVCRSCGELLWEDMFALRTLAPLAPADIQAFRDRRANWTRQQDADQKAQEQRLLALMAPLQEELSRLKRRVEKLEMGLPPEAPMPVPEEPEREEVDTDMEALRKSALGGDPESQYQLGLRYYSGLGAAKSYISAASMFRQASEKGHAGAQNMLGECYRHGRGVNVSPQMAELWFRKAAEQEDAEAQNNLGVCYEKGIGVPRNSKKAFQWYQKAADNGSANGQNNLGWCYENGLGVPQNLVWAEQWYRQAARQGHGGAQGNLRRLPKAQASEK